MEPPQPRSGEEERPGPRPAATHHQAARKEPNHICGTLPAQLRETLHTPSSATVALSQEAVCVATTGRIRRRLIGHQG
jgi:hypothetical protein